MLDALSLSHSLLPALHNLLIVRSNVLATYLTPLCMKLCVARRRILWWAVTYMRPPPVMVRVHRMSSICNWSLGLRGVIPSVNWILLWVRGDRLWYVVSVTYESFR